VEELWSPTLSPFRKIARQIQLQIDVRIFARARRAFLSRAGPRSDLVLLQAGHHLILVRHRSPPKTTKATLWVALEKLLCASDLAHLPLHEGRSVPRPARGAGRRMPDELPRDGIGRSGGIRGWAGGIRHDLIPFHVRG